MQSVEFIDNNRMIIDFTKQFSIHNRAVSCRAELLVGNLNLLVGDNGVGKSTFFHYVKNNFKSLFPNDKVAFMDQFPLRSISELRVCDIINTLEEDFKSFDKEKANHLFELFDFAKFNLAVLNQLSGGENQIFKFIITNSQKASLYFLDEPLQFLDSKNLIKVKEVIAAQVKEGKTFFMIEHRKELVKDLAKNWIQMEISEEEIFITNMNKNEEASQWN